MFRLSIPIKVILVGGVTYLLSLGLALILDVAWGIDFDSLLWTLSMRTWVWGIQWVLVTASMVIASHYFLDRPLRKLQDIMRKAEKGDFLVRAPSVGPDELSELAANFNRMLGKLTDLSVNKIQTEHDLVMVHEELKYKKSLEEKKELIEKANQQLEELVRDLSLLYEIGQGINQTIDLESLYQVVCEVIQKRLRLNNFSLMVWDEVHRMLSVKTAFGFKNVEKVLQMTFQVGEGIAGEVMVTGKMHYVADCSKDMKFTNKGVGVEGSILMLPLKYKKEVLGVINFGREEINGFSRQDIRMLKLVANQVALAISNARLHTQTRELSVTDELTGVHNRRHFQSVLQLEWKRAIRFDRPLSLLMVDVDFFKQYNDTYGHLSGDQALRQIGFLLKNSLREVDTVARFGGEEFVILLPDTDKKGALAVAEKLRLKIQDHTFLKDKKPTRPVTVSVGVSGFPADVKEMDELIDHADIVLYEAKDKGRNRSIVHPDRAPGEEEPAAKIEKSQLLH